ncbi:hypothetical protein ACIBTV_14205 [Micromonospora sp. NPDC049366]|uniref:hypothetical protein n=1 Tax=Micromonospora sp. NPDC049366 TaxID=3364271 RepID=UPI00378A830A
MTSTDQSNHAPTRPATIVRAGRRARAVVLALAGLVMLGAAYGRPWVEVREGRDNVELLLGRPPSGEVRTFALIDLPGSLIALCVGWLALLALFAVAWARPQWRDVLRLALGAATLVVIALTFLPNGAALSASGFPTKDYPSTHYLQGTWLGLSGLLLLSGAVSALLAAPHRSAVSAPGKPHTTEPRTPETQTAETQAAEVRAAEAPTTQAPTADAALAPPAQDDDTPRTDREPSPTSGPEATTSGPEATPHHEPDSSVASEPELILPSVPGLARRQAPPPRWHRPARITAVTLALVGAVALIAVVSWKIAHSPAPEAGQENTLVARIVAPPEDATPITVPDANGRAAFADIVALDSSPQALLAAMQLAGVQQSARSAWAEPDSASMRVVLLQFESAEPAEEFVRLYTDAERSVRTPGGEVGLASVPGGTAFIGPAGNGSALPEVHAVAQHDDVVLLVTAGGEASDDVTAAESLLRQQYERL